MIKRDINSLCSHHCGMAISLTAENPGDKHVKEFVNCMFTCIFPCRCDGCVPVNFFHLWKLITGTDDVVDKKTTKPTFI